MVRGRSSVQSRSTAPNRDILFWGIELGCGKIRYLALCVTKLAPFCHLSSVGRARLS